MDEDTLQKYIQAGKIAAQARDYGKKLIKVCVPIVEVCDAVETKIRELGGDIAFPAQVSCNQIAAHFCPSEEDETIFKDGDLAKLDVGAHVDGFVGDTAVSVDLGDHKELVEASRKALNAAMKLVKPGVTLSEIGTAIHDTITNLGFSPIKNLSGHGLDRFNIHTWPSIPNFDTGDDTPLEEGMAIAIEPFATDGAGMIYESSNPTLYSLANKKPVRSMMTRLLLRDIEKYNGLPFTSRWLTRKHGTGKFRFALKEMKNLEMLKEFPPLPDKNEGIVSQAEHSFIVQDKPIITTLLDED